MRPADLTTHQAREFARATVSIRTKIDHTTASHDALVGAIEKDLATNLSTKRAFAAFTANADRSTAQAFTARDGESDPQADTTHPTILERVNSRADRALRVRADETRLSTSPRASARAEAALAIWSSQRRVSGGTSKPSKSNRASKALEMRFGTPNQDDGQ